jgi:hypothetical protein
MRHNSSSSRLHIVLLGTLYQLGGGGAGVLNASTWLKSHRRKEPAVAGLCPCLAWGTAAAGGDNSSCCCVCSLHWADPVPYTHTSVGVYRSLSPGGVVFDLAKAAAAAPQR